MVPFQTSLDDVICTGWTRIGSVWLTTEPLREQSSGRYAHLSYRGALAVAERFGAELPSAADLDALREVAIVLTPVTLPDLQMLRQAGICAGNRAAIGAFRCAHMAGEDWAQIHDERVQAQLDALGWDGGRPIIGAGKQWIAGAPRGRAWLKGWPLPNGRWIQTGVEAPGAAGPHDDLHVDYAMVPVLKRTG